MGNDGVSSNVWERLDKIFNDCTLQLLCGAQKLTAKKSIYWSLTALDLLGQLDQLPREEMIAYVFSCLNKNGGFSPAPNHYPTIIYTLSAIQVLVILKAVDQLGEKKQNVIDFVKSLQNSDGSFVGSPDDDKEETDTRFSFCAIATLKLLNALDEIDTSKTVDHIKACQNFDGAFGVRVGSESHAGQVFCCVGTLALLEKLEIIDLELLGWWLADRQVNARGLDRILTFLASMWRTKWKTDEKGGRLLFMVGIIKSGYDKKISLDRPSKTRGIYSICCGKKCLTYLELF